MSVFHDVLHFLGHAICRQIEDRSFIVSEAALAVCARDSGIYIGIFSTLLYLHVTKRNKIITIPSIKISFILLLFMVPLIIDGLGSYSSLFESNNTRRLVTGILFGFVLPYFLYPLLSGQPHDNESEPVIIHAKDVYFPLILSSMLGGGVYWGQLSHILLDSFIMMNVIIWFSLCASFMFAVIKKKYIKWLFSLISSILFLSFLSILHSWLI